MIFLAHSMVELEQLTNGGTSDGARRARDDAVRQMTHSDYLTTDIEPDRLVRVAQVSAPVPGADGVVTDSR